MMGSVLPAIPDFKWSAATDGIADKDGYAIVITQVWSSARGIVHGAATGTAAPLACGGPMLRILSSCGYINRCPVHDPCWSIKP